MPKLPIEEVTLEQLADRVFQSRPVGRVFRYLETDLMVVGHVRSRASCAHYSIPVLMLLCEYRDHHGVIREKTFSGAGLLAAAVWPDGYRLLPEPPPPPRPAD